MPHETMIFACTICVYHITLFRWIRTSLSLIYSKYNDVSYISSIYFSPTPNTCIYFPLNKEYDHRFTPLKAFMCAKHILCGLKLSSRVADGYK